MSFEHLGEPAGINLAALLIKRYQVITRPRSREDVLAFLVNNPPRVATDVIAIPQLGNLNRSEFSNAIHVVSDKLLQRSPLRFSDPQESQLHNNSAATAAASSAPGSRSGLCRYYSAASSHKDSCG